MKIQAASANQGHLAAKGWALVQAATAMLALLGASCVVEDGPPPDVASSHGWQIELDMSERVVRIDVVEGFAIDEGRVALVCESVAPDGAVVVEAVSESVALPGLGALRLEVPPGQYDSVRLSLSLPAAAVRTADEERYLPVRRLDVSRWERGWGGDWRQVYARRADQWPQWLDVNVQRTGVSFDAVVLALRAEDFELCGGGMVQSSGHVALGWVVPEPLILVMTPVDMQGFNDFLELSLEDVQTLFRSEGVAVVDWRPALIARPVSIVSREPLDRVVVAGPLLSDGVHVGSPIVVDVGPVPQVLSLVAGDYIFFDSLLSYELDRGGVPVSWTETAEGLFVEF